MNDNLAQLIQNEQVGQENPATDFESHENVENTQEETPIDQSIIVETEAPEEIGVVMLSEWFEDNNSNLEKINRIRIQVVGVDPLERLVCSVLDPKGEDDEHGHPVRHLELIKDANVFPVLDLPGYDMDVFGNGFQILYSLNENVVLKCYGIKTGLIVVFCNVINDQLIPYHRVKLKKKDTGITITLPNVEFIENNITNVPLDLEGLQIQYKQVQKELDQISDKQSAINWLLDKQSIIRDINHLLQIDDILIWLIS